MEGLPKLTEPVIEFIDATPDDDYPLRILRAYRHNCDVRFATDFDGNCDHQLFSLMNEHCEQRAKILDRAISLLERSGRMVS